MSLASWAMRLDDPEQLEEAVRRRINGRLRRFQLVVTENGLVLRGRAPSYYAKQLAQQAVMAETDFPIFANEIEVI